MKKNFLKFLLVVLFLILIATIYLSTIGIETKRLNKQIINIISIYSEGIETELKQIKIILDPFKFEINAKTTSPKFKIKEKTIEMESIKTQISIKSLINNQFSLKNLDISTKSLEIKNLISFARNFQNNTELYLLEKIIKKGYLISDIYLEFDQQGKIKKNYKINGFIKNGKINLLNKYDLKNIDLLFNYTHNRLELNDTKLNLNNTPLISKNILIKNIDNIFLI